MKRSFIFVFFITQFCFSQVPNIQWQKCLGGSGLEKAQSIQTTTDGGYVIAGSTTESNDGNVSGNNGFHDGWVVKLSNTGDLQWQKCLGGVFDDILYSIRQTIDGGYLAMGVTTSSNLNLSGVDGDGDFWVVKLSSTGEIEWQKVLGGTSNEVGVSIDQTVDGGFILAGRTSSNDINVSGNHGNYDIWVVKLSNSGNLMWQKCFGGTSNESFLCLRQTSDQGFILTGSTTSNDGNVTGNHGLSDAWVVKLSNSGSLEWQKSFGGTEYDYAYSIQETTDGGYIFAGSTKSNDGNVSGYHGGTDAWVVKLSNIGVIEWQESLGGNSSDWAYNIIQTAEGNFIFVGYTDSTGGDVSGNHGGSDAWLVKLSPSGTIIWQKTLGGSNNDNGFDIHQTTDGGYIMAGSSSSSDGDVSGNHGSSDFWTVKLAPESMGTTAFKTNTITLFPNPTTSNLRVTSGINLPCTKIVVTDMTGATMLVQDQISDQINVEKLARGMYILQAFSGENLFTCKFMKE